MGRSRSLTLATLIIFFSWRAAAQWQSIGTLDSYRWTNDREILLQSGTALVSVQILTDDLVRVRMIPAGAFAPDRSRAVIRQSWPAVRPVITDAPNRLIISTQVLRAVIRKKPLRITFEDSTGAMLCADDSVRGMSWAGTEVRVWKAMRDDEAYVGFGEKAGKLNRRGTHMTMWNSDIPAYTADTDPLYESIPFFITLAGGHTSGIFLDNTTRTSFDMGKECRDAYSFGAESGELNYYFFAGPTPRNIISRFTELVGRMPLPPRWALGYQQCRWSYPTEQRVKEIARGFRDRSIPCDVIYLDIDYMDGYRIFTWNRKNFPDPERMIGELAREGFKIAVIVDPGIKVDSTYDAFRSGLAGGHFLRNPDGTLFTGKVWPGVCAFPDFTSPRARDWWGKNFAGLVSAGVRGWWNDMNEPSVFDVRGNTVDPAVVHDDDGARTPHAKNHNVYGLEMTHATRDGVQKLTPDERVFVLTRATYAGGQRYSAAWTGDNVASWEHLAMALRMCLNLSISGQPFVGSDIGGFIGYPSGELFARWLQFGVFTPLMRAHSVINERNKEPWEFGDEMTAVNRETINLRYRFLPYIYMVMHEASETGIPAMRPLFLEFPDDPRLPGVDQAFLFGRDILVVPVLGEGGRTSGVDLPAGVWYDFWTDSAYTGMRHVELDAPLNRLPFLVRAGGIIPLQPVMQYSDERPVDPLTFALYPPGPSGESAVTYYEDDGHTMQYRNNVSYRRAVSQVRTATDLTVRLDKPEGSYHPPARNLLLEVHGTSFAPASVSINGRAVDRATGSSAERSSWSFDPRRNVISIKLKDSQIRLDIVSKIR